jgi:cellulose synthase/poly-beta-1,6-N-acetylglucosamine synthase-like glycosyltransferase
MTDFLPVFDFSFGTYLFLCFSFFSFVQLLFLVFVFSRLAFYRDKRKTSVTPNVTIIIAARNEADNLFKNLPFILDQDYPNFEVIVVNHQSMDESKYILDAFENEFPNMRVINVEKSQHMKFGKKLPLTIGIKGAKYEHLLFTDADCHPASNQWLKSMSSHFSQKHEIVLGYGPYKKKKGLLNKFIRFDTAWIALNYFSFAKAKMPYMGIGRNMAYTKTVFNSVSGFKSHYALSSGDDDLFIQEAAKKGNYTINLDPDSFCYSNPPKTWSSWMRQKSRHYTTTERYKVIKKLLLGIYPLTLLLMLLSFVTLLFDSNFIWLTLSVFGFILVVKWFILGKALKKMNETKFIAYLPLLDIAYAILAPAMYYSIDKKDKNKW